MLGVEGCGVGAASGVDLESLFVLLHSLMWDDMEPMAWAIQADSSLYCTRPRPSPVPPPAAPPPLMPSCYFDFL